MELDIPSRENIVKTYHNIRNEISLYDEVSYANGKKHRYNIITYL